MDPTMKEWLPKYFVISCIILALVINLGCFSAPKNLTITSKAAENGFYASQYKTALFDIFTAQKISSSPNNIHIYLEGDGNSWQSRYKLSDNPTPNNPVGFKLALQDKHQDIIYLARPCQYVNLKSQKSCKPKYWSSHRYSEAVIDSYQEILDQLKQQYTHAQFKLIGFSGGGTIAVLLGSKRKDISEIITIAAALNNAELSKIHQTTPLTGSLEPYSIAKQIRTIKQVHFVGEKDNIVPPRIAQQFVKQQGENNDSHVVVVKNSNHHNIWKSITIN